MANAQVDYFSFASTIDLLKDNDIKGISIRDLEIIKENRVKLAKKLNISLAEIILKNNWYIYDGEYYYYKRLDSAFRIMNELIGVYLSKYMSVPTVEYTLALDFGKIVGLLSKNFRKLKKRYYLATCVNSKYLKKFSNSLNEPIVDELRKSLDRLIMKDFYSCMTDRVRNTLVSMTRLKNVSLETSFDYEMSFIDEIDSLYPRFEKNEAHEFDRYFNPLFYNDDEDKSYGEINYDTLKGMMEYDEYLIYLFERIMDFDIAKAIKCIEEENGMVVADDLKNYYINFDKIRKDELSRNLRK